MDDWSTLTIRIKEAMPGPQIEQIKRIEHGESNDAVVVNEGRVVVTEQSHEGQPTGWLVR
jgi:hypothetical protein